MKQRIYFLALALWFVPSATGLTQQLVYTVSGTGFGTLGTQSFSNAFFQLTAMADTTLIYSPTSGLYYVPDSVAKVYVAGRGTGTFVDSMVETASQTYTGAGLGDPALNRAVMYVKNPGFATYDLSTPIGPLSGYPAYNSGLAFRTTAGDFVLTGGISALAFEATPLPDLPEFTAITALADGNVQLTLSAAPTVIWRVEATTNLAEPASWVTVTNVVTATGTIQFSDLNATNLPQRFYRAVWP